MDNDHITYKQLEDYVWKYPGGCGAGKRDFLEFVTRKSVPLVVPINHEKVHVEVTLEVNLDYSAYQRQYGANLNMCDQELTNWILQVCGQNVPPHFQSIIELVSKEIVIDRDVKDEPEMQQEQEFVRDQFGRFAKKEA